MILQQQQTDARLRVLVLAGGGLGHVSGGVGTLMAYLMAAWAARPDGPDVQVVDTRGEGGRGAGAVGFLGVLARVAWLCAAARVDLVHAHMTTRGSVVRKLVLCGLARGLGVACVVHMHGADFEAFYRGLHPVARGTIGRVLRSASRVIVLGEAWRDFLVGGVGLAPGRVAVVLNGVTRPPARPVRRDGPARILFLGRIGDRKGVPELLAALAAPALRGRAWQAVIAGDGEVARLAAMRDRLGLAGRVEMPGWVDGVAAAGLLGQADMLVLPSHHEAFPIAVIEALAHGVAVITTPVGAVPEVLCDGVSALLVPPGDVDALAGALVRLLDDAAARYRLGEAGEAVFRRRLDVSVTAERVLSIYREAVGERQTARAGWAAQPDGVQG